MSENTTGQLPVHTDGQVIESLRAEIRVMQRAMEQDAKDFAVMRSLRDTAQEQQPMCGECNEGRPAVCIGNYDQAGIAYACDECCGHGCEDGWCCPLDEIPQRMKAGRENWEKAIAQRDSALALLAAARSERDEALEQAIKAEGRYSTLTGDDMIVVTKMQHEADMDQWTHEVRSTEREAIAAWLEEQLAKPMSAESELIIAAIRSSHPAQSAQRTEGE